MPDEESPTEAHEGSETVASDSRPPKQVPDHGADSMLRCYNSTEWRLEDLFGSEEELKPESKPAEPPLRK